MRHAIRHPGPWFAHRFLRIVMLAAGSLLLLQCDSPQAPDAEDQTTDSRIAGNAFTPLDDELTRTLRSLLTNHLGEAEAEFATTEGRLARLQFAVTDFLAMPAPDTLAEARTAWLAAHSSYEITAVNRYLGALLAAPSMEQDWLLLQYRLNHWPIFPGYLDYVENYPDSGLVYDTGIALTEATLREQHGAFGIDEVSTGFHVLEYLLWGETGQPRPASDYDEATELTAAQADSGMTIGQLPTNRRRQLLSLVSSALVEDFGALYSLWQIAADDTLAQRDSTDGAEILWLILEASSNMLTEELLVRSLYPLLNLEYVTSFQSPYSRTTQNAVSAQLSGLEQLILQSAADGGQTLDRILSQISVDFEEFFYAGFDATKECLVVLYSGFEIPTTTVGAASTEFEIVECINLVTNLADQFEQIETAQLVSN